MAEIETARLRLRLCTHDDLDALADLFGDAEVMRYIGVESGKALTRAETEGVLDNIISGWHRRGFGRWAVLLKATHQLIGLCGLKLLEGTPELMYILRRAHRRRDQT
jgi:RimJ/RimL family protein N-acetyltransferase